jgi:hypothetical protein
MERLGEITVADIRARLASPRSPAAETADGSEDPAADHQPGQQADIINRLRWAELRSWASLLIALAALMLAWMGSDPA